jgi:hypothetical protein
VFFGLYPAFSVTCPFEKSSPAAYGKVYTNQAEQDHAAYAAYKGTIRAGRIEVEAEE